jgi:RNA ligase
MSAKYPRSFHLPWSPGGTSDDKRLKRVARLCGEEIVITEKLDGSNLTYARKSVFARSHAGPPTHRSFDLAKAAHARIGHQIDPKLSIFCEYCFAIHSIAYDALPDYSLVFGVRDDVAASWYAWDDVKVQAFQLGLPTVPELFRGVVADARALEELTSTLAEQPSAFGGIREGVVVRLARAYADAEFSESLGKWVRKDHVTTDEHWMHQNIRAQKLRPRPSSL